MTSFEQEIKSYFKINDIPYKDYSQSYKRLDFTIQLGKWKFYFDAKEKRQKYNLKNWQLSEEEEKHAFIIDDLAARKILAYAPYSATIIRNNLNSCYYFFSVLDLFLMPKKRVNRPIFNKKKALKGKWIIDLRNGIKCDKFDTAYQLIGKYIEKREELFINHLPCFGEYEGEEIGERGMVRKREYWDIDVKATR